MGNLRRSKSEVYYHFVWATLRRLPLLTADIERAVLRRIEGEAQHLGCHVLAINSMPDHVHICLRAPNTHPPSEIAQRLKGVSSHFAHVCLPGEEGFRWQENYSVFSISRSHVARVVQYINAQKEHHSANHTWPEWEESDEEGSEERGA